MSRARHEVAEFGHEKHDKEMKPEAYTAKGSHVEGEAEKGEEGEKMHKGGRKKRAEGGRMHHEEHVEGHHGKKRYDRPGRKRGGAIGSNSHPLSSAAKVEKAEDHDATDGNSEDD